MEIPHSTPPHGSEPVLTVGNTTHPTRALLLIHGRGSSAQNIAALTTQLQLPDEYLILAPQAADHTWYPERFIVPQAQNQPHLDAALERIATITTYLNTQWAIPPAQIVLAGFSQGACLVAEFLARYPQRYQGAAIFSGGLIGDAAEVAQAVTGDLQHTPIYLGCDVADFHIPQERVVATAASLKALNGNVDLKLYEGLGHTIHPEGIAALQNYIDAET